MLFVAWDMAEDMVGDGTFLWVAAIADNFTDIIRNTIRETTKRYPRYA